MFKQRTYGKELSRQRLDVDSVVTRQSLRVAEWHLYGSSRLGIYKTQDTLRTVDLSLVYKLSDVNIAPTQTLSRKEFYSFDSTYTHKRGDKLYEGSNHLGNVLVTFSDKRLAECSEGSVLYQADVRSATDYAAFGALLDDRQWYSSTDSAFYRYGGSNGQEKDDEIYGTGNSYSAEFWQYDPRLARRWNVDPKPNPSFSFYSCFANNPIVFVDLHGDTIKGDMDAYNQVKKFVANKITSLNEQIEDAKKDIEVRKSQGKKTKRQERNFQKLSNSLKLYKGILDEYNTLENSTQVYNIITGGQVPKGAGGIIQFDKQTGYINLITSGNMNVLESLPHELKHAFQFEVGKLSFIYNSGNAGDLYDLQDEVEAYQRGQAFGFNTDEVIDVHWVLRRGYSYDLSRIQLTMETIVEPKFSTNTMGDQLKGSIRIAGKRAEMPKSVIKTWEVYYKQGESQR